MTKDLNRYRVRELDRKIGRGLRDIRRMRNHTQQEIADALGVSFQQIQKYERGESRVSAATALIWLVALDVLPPELLKGLPVATSPARSAICGAVGLASELGQSPRTHLIGKCLGITLGLWSAIQPSLPNCVSGWHTNAWIDSRAMRAQTTGAGLALPRPLTYSNSSWDQSMSVSAGHRPHRCCLEWFSRAACVAGGRFGLGVPAGRNRAGQTHTHRSLSIQDPVGIECGRSTKRCDAAGWRA
ncbi:MAG: helix-turn-helix transcriptional regulator [Planctomycetota bacterium]